MLPKLMAAATGSRLRVRAFILVNGSIPTDQNQILALLSPVAKQRGTLQNPTRSLFQAALHQETISSASNSSASTTLTPAVFRSSTSAALKSKSPVVVRRLAHLLSRSLERSNRPTPATLPTSTMASRVTPFLDQLHSRARRR
jgi:hypothetical protein